jgi:hypothetical protein
VYFSFSFILELSTHLVFKDTLPRYKKNSLYFFIRR